MPSRKRKSPLEESFDAFLKDGKTFVPSPYSLAAECDAADDVLKGKALRIRALENFFIFATEICGDVSLDLHFHGPVCRFMEAGESHTMPFDEAHYLWTKRPDLPLDGGLSKPIAAPAGKNRWAVELDGTFRGEYMALRGDGRLKIMLLPRGHIKTGILEDYCLWLQARSLDQFQRPIRIALCCERQQLAKDILHGIRRKIEKNSKMHAVFPDMVPACFRRKGGMPGARPKDLTWDAAAIELPGSQNMYEREPSISCYGVATGITGCHFDRIFFDDIVTQKNIGTDVQIAKVRQFVEDALFLLDPQGKVLDVGTRWHFADAHGAILDGSLIGIDAASLCFATIDGSDNEPMFPFLNRRGRKYGFSRESIRKLLDGDPANRILPMSRERFSSQYRNQPIEGKDSLFPRDHWRYFDLEEHLASANRAAHTRWGLCDPAIKKYPGQTQGDFAFMCIVDCMVNGEWRILDARHGRWTIDELLDQFDELQKKYQPILMGVEAGQYENTIKYAATVRDLALNVQPIDSPMNRESKIMRCQRITGKQKSGNILVPGNPNLKLKDQYWDIPEWARTLIEEAAKFPKGMYDDCIDTLGYGPDVIVPPLFEGQEIREKSMPVSAMHILDLINAAGDTDAHPVLGVCR